jgi:hypothetical protein
MPKRTHRNPDHVKRHNQPSPNNEAITSQLETLLTPAIFAQQGYYRQARITRSHIKSVIDGGCGVDSPVATGSYPDFSQAKKIIQKSDTNGILLDT